MHIILLSGGSGTRLWPLSNTTRSKQFLKVLRDPCGNPQSMVQRVVGQIRTELPEANLTIATTDSQISEIRTQINGEYELVIEPERRDTAPAIMLSCAHLSSMQNVNPDDTIVVMPIDVYADNEFFRAIESLSDTIHDTLGDLILLGVEPALASEKYGYILPKSHSDGSQSYFEVSSFIEKPNTAVAQQLIDQGALWNCGVFAFKLGYVLDLIRGYSIASDFQSVYDSYCLLPKKSFDYEIVEKAERICVVPYGGAWKDLGSWNTLSEEMDMSISGRVVADENNQNVNIINELGLPLVALGLKDMVIVATPDGILITDKERSAHMKPYVEKAKETRPMYERRLWGEYHVLYQDVLSDNAYSLVKLLTINAGRQLSYQRHRHRAETWTVIDGSGMVVLDGCVERIERGSVINIDVGVHHALLSETQVKIVEVQTGSSLEEEDIERFGFWNEWE